MKRRVTFTHDAGGAFSPENARLSSDSVSLQSLNGARQERLTFGFLELPNEIQQVLRQCVELHIRWATENHSPSSALFPSRVSAGLHISLSPLTLDKSQYLCPLLQKAFGAASTCNIPEISFVSSGEIIQSGALPSLQFYELLPTLDPFITYIQEAICQKKNTSCREDASLLRNADVLDIDYDRVSNSFSITALWSKPIGNHAWKTTIYNGGLSQDKIDVGILALQESIDPIELRVGGFLAVVGRDKELKPTLFSFPSRHHPLPESYMYKTQFSSPTGLHPTLHISFPNSAPAPLSAPPDATCKLYTHLTLPSYLFADKYQLSTSDPLFLQSHNLRTLKHITGETDLEAPDWIIKRWGSHLLLELVTPGDDGGILRNKGTGIWESTIPLHLRYLHPSESGYQNISVPWPVVFWACTLKDQEKMGSNPFDRTHLIWDDTFGPKTLFYHFHPAPGPNHNDGKLVERLQVPVLQVEKESSFPWNHAKQIEFGTTAVIVAGFLWVLFILGLVVRSSGIRRPQSQKVEEKKVQ